MKTIIILSILLLSGRTVPFVNKEPVRSHPGSVKKKVRVVVIGFKQGNLLSNYYMDDSLAKFTGIPQDSLHQKFSRAIIENFKPDKSPRIEFEVLEDTALCHSVLNRISYANEGETSTVDFSKVPLKDLLEAQKANYLLLIDRYEINYIISPYKTFYYIVKYSLVNSKSEKLHEGRVFFEYPEIVPLNMLAKKHEKQVQRIMSQTERLLCDRW